MSNPSQSLPRSGPKLHPAEWALQAGAINDVLGEMKVQLERRRRRRRKAAVSAVSAAGCLALALWLVPLIRDTSAVATPSAERLALTLPDGSKADLNARTRLRTDFRYGRRIIHLDRGEAFFDVAKDSRHPFFVETEAGTVRVTGTHFSVRVPDQPGVEVVLVEGSVSFAPSGPGTNPLKLVSGQQLQIAAGKTDLRTLNQAELDRKEAWREGRAVFEGDSLTEAAACFAEFHGVTIVVDPMVAGLRLGGTYPLADLKEFLAALETTLPVKVVSEAQTYRIVAR